MSRRMRKLVLVLLIGVVGVGGLGSLGVVLRKAQIRSAIQDGYQRGRAEFEAGRYENALPLIARYVGRHQQDAEALLLLAECRARVPKPEGTELMEAARYAEAALTADPDSVKALEMLIGYYSQLGFVTELSRTCDSLLKLRPDDRRALSAQAQALAALGRYDDAGKVAERLIAAAPADADGHRMLLQIRRQQGASGAELADAAGKLAASQPQSFELAVVHAQTLLGIGDLEGAATAARDASSLTPSTLRAVADYLRLMDVFLVLVRSGERAPSLPTIETPQQFARGVLDAVLADQRLAVGGAALAAGWHWRGGRQADAAQRIEQGLAVEPEAPALLGWKRLVAQAGQTGASQSADEAIAGDAPEARWWTALFASIDQIDDRRWVDGSTALRTLQSEISRAAVVDTLVDSDPESERTRAVGDQIARLAGFYEAVCAEGLGEWQRAVKLWRELADGEPGWSMPHIRAAQALLSRDRLDGALESATAAFRSRGGPIEALVLARAIVAHLEAGRSAGPMAESLDTIVEALAGEPALRTEVEGLKLRIALIRGDTAAIDAGVRALIAADPPANAGELVATAARVRAAGGAGWESLLAAAEARGGAGATATVRAQVSIDAGRRDEAVALLDAAADAATDPAEATRLRLAQALVLSDGGRTADARAVLAAISEANPDAAVQLMVLENPAAWTDATLASAVTGRLRSAAGDSSIEWKLADTTRVLTFSPEPAQAQAMIVRLNDVIRADPSNAQAMALLAEWLVISGNQQGAIDALTRASAIPDAPPNVHLRLIGLERQSGRIDAARTHARRFAEVQGLPLDVRRVRAQLLTELNLPELALRDAEALSQSGAAADQLARARTMLQAGDRDGAAGAAESLATDSRLERRDFLQALGVLVAAGRADRALALFDGRITPSDPRRVLDRAALLEVAGRVDDAEAALRAAVDTGGDRDAYLELARLQLRRGNVDAVASTIAAASERGFTGDDFDGVAALALARTGEVTETQARDIIDGIPAGPLRDLAEATRWYDQNPTQTEEFIERLRPIVRSAPGLLIASRLLVEALLQSGEINDAVIAARNAAGASPTSADAAAMLTRTLLTAGRADEARVAAQSWRTLSENGLEPTTVLAHIELDAGRRDDARLLLTPIVARAAEIAPTASLDQWASLVSALARAGDIRSAQHVAAARAPDERGWPAILAQIAGGDAQPIDAARDWLRSLEAAVMPLPDGALIFANAKAALASRSGLHSDLEAAYDVIDQRLRSDDATVSDLTLGATLLEQLKREPEAEPLYRRVIAMDPAQWVALNNLANILSARPDAAKEALELARKGYELTEGLPLNDATRALVVHTLAKCQSLAGDQQQALINVRRAVTLDRSLVEARFTEADVLERAGERRRAADVLELMVRHDAEGILRLSDAERTRIDTQRQRLLQ